ncbi:MAG: PTS sugar transporter subunit IIA [Lachnospiraceae bacterium]
MKRHFIIASHSKLASGMASTILFFAGEIVELATLDAYLDNKPIEEQVKQLVEAVPDGDETIIFTDIMAGSVNQKFMPYINRPHTHLISGMNLPILVALSMESQEDYLTEDTIARLLEDAKEQLVYVNRFALDRDDAEDE